MIKIVTLPASIGIQYPKWFYTSLAYLHQGHDLEFKRSKTSRFSPSGAALIEVIFAEAKALNRKVKGSVPKPLTFPHYSKTYCLDWFTTSLKPLFLERFLALHANTLTEDDAFDFQLLYTELTQNARDHAGAEQFLVLLSPNEIGVFDLGVSIPAKLEQKYNFSSDLDSIEQATKRGITTRRLRPGGFGLYYTLAQLREREGTFFIASRQGQVRSYLRNRTVTRKKIDPPMRGTLIHCTLEAKRKRKTKNEDD